jgi:hypothetical protein
MASSPLLDTTIVQAHDCQNDVDDDHDVEKTNRSSAHLLDIALASAFVAIPVIGIVIGLLAIINSHRVPESDIFLLSDQLAQGSCSQPSFQIAFSATTLTFLASLLSTFAAYVAVPFMFLLSFRIARSLKQKSDEVAPDLPTPYQTSLLISLIGGNVGSLWSWTRYVTRSRRKRVSSPSNELSLATYSLSCLLALGLVKSYSHVQGRSVNHLLSGCYASSATPGSTKRHKPLFSLI